MILETVQVSFFFRGVPEDVILYFFLLCRHNIIKHIKVATYEILSLKLDPWQWQAWLAVL